MLETASAFLPDRAWPYVTSIALSGDAAKRSRRVGRRRSGTGNDAQALSLLEFGLFAEGPYVPGREGPRMGEPARRHFRLRELRAALHRAQSEGCGADARPRRQGAD